MSAEAYEILALAMRYVFTFLIVLIVLRAWRLTAIDSSRAKKLRRLNPETGIIGEMLVLEGGEKARPGMKYSVTLEGTIGSAPRADIRLRHSSVRRRHAYFMMTDEGLFIRGHAGARIGTEGKWLREVTLQDGDEILLGRVRLLLVLSDGGGTPEEMIRRARRRRADSAEREFADEAMVSHSRRPDNEYTDEYIDEYVDEYGKDIFSVHEANEETNMGMENETTGNGINPDGMFDTRRAYPQDRNGKAKADGMGTDDMFFTNPASCLNPDDYDGFDDYDDPY